MEEPKVAGPEADGEEAGSYNKVQDALRSGYHACLGDCFSDRRTSDAAAGRLANAEPRIQSRGRTASTNSRQPEAPRSSSARA